MGDWHPVPTQGGHGSLHTACPNTHGTDRPHWVQVGPGRWFECTGCAGTRHIRLCVDSEGKTECVCGLDERESARLDHEAQIALAKRRSFVR